MEPRLRSAAKMESVVAESEKPAEPAAETPAGKIAPSGKSAAASERCARSLSPRGFGTEVNGAVNDRGVLAGIARKTRECAKDFASEWSGREDLNSLSGRNFGNKFAVFLRIYAVERARIRPAVPSEVNGAVNALSPPGFSMLRRPAEHYTLATVARVHYGARNWRSAHDPSPSSAPPL